MNGFPNRQQGLTLIEILIALLLGAFLIGGVLEIFVNTRETYKLQEALSRLQENGRFAMDFIGRDIRMAGYSFCPRPTETGVLEPTPASPPYALTSPPNVPPYFLSGTDGALNGANQDSPDSITMTWIGESATCTLPALPTTVAYTVVNNAATGLNELQRNGVALIEGVENMQILYGYDTGITSHGTPDFYGRAGQAADIRRIVSVRVSLLLYSTEQPVPSVLDVPASVVFNNENTVIDRRARRVFTSTFVLRNRYDVITPPSAP